MKKCYLNIFVLLAVLFSSAESFAQEFKQEFVQQQRPHLLVTQDAIAQAHEKMEKYEWAAKNGASMIEFADNFVVPRPSLKTVKRSNGETWRNMGYNCTTIEQLFTVGLAYTLENKQEYLDKMMLFINDVCDEQSGYLKVGVATSGSEVHEGVFFTSFAGICDILYSVDGLLSADQKSDIEAVMRAYLERSKSNMAGNGIMNHQASTNAAAVTVSMFLQDKEYFDHFVESDGGMIDHIATGFMPDGWWFEGTVNYCYLVTNIYFRMAQIFQNNGMDLYNRTFEAREMDKDFHNAKDGFTGMKFAIWGPEKPTRCIYDAAVAHIPMMDEDGWVVASNDTNATPPAPFYELAYKEYGDKELAWAISKSDRSSWISLFYGVGKLPTVKDPRTKSATIPNVGLTALRAQGKGREGAEQLQAYVKYGSHGGWHGQYDRVSLQALDKYGHKFFSTEMCWFGYGSAQYKELVQTSIAHNMVIVDELQQEALPSSQPVFYAGDMMQVSVTETKARWRPIPRNNPDLFPPWDDFDFVTEPVVQRRVAMVTDDYLLMVDYLKGEKIHQYDYLVHPAGFVAVEGAQKVGAVKDKVNTDPATPFKYFNNCQWYKGEDQTTKFVFNDAGVGLDVHLAWPHNGDILFADYPRTGGAAHGGLRNNPERRTMGVRVNDTEVVYITVLEPYKGESVIEQVVATSEDKINVYLKDGSIHLIEVWNLRAPSAEAIKVELTQTSTKGKSKKEIN